MSQTLEIQNSIAPFETSLVSPEVTVVLEATISLTLKPVPVAGVITVEAGIITRTSPTGLNTTAPVLLIVSDSAFVTVPESVADQRRVHAVTTVVTIPESPELYDSELVARVPVASCDTGNANDCHTEVTKKADKTQIEINCFFIWKRLY